MIAGRVRHLSVTLKKNVTRGSPSYTWYMFVPRMQKNVDLVSWRCCKSAIYAYCATKTQRTSQRLRASTKRYCYLSVETTRPTKHASIGFGNYELIKRSMAMFLNRRNKQLQVTGNVMVNCASYGVKIVSSPQTMICGNEAELPEGETEDTVSPQLSLTNDARSLET